MMSVGECFRLFVHISGIVAPITSVVVGMSPLPTVQRIRRDKKIGNYPLLPYTSMVITSTLSFAYGVLRENAMIWTSSAISVVLGLYYLLSYVQFAHTMADHTVLPGSVESHIITVSFAMMSTIIWTIVPMSQPSPDWLIGKVGLLFRVLMFASPLTTLRVVIATKSARSIPLPFAIASAVNCVLWTVFGLFQVKDANIYLPNILGLLFAVAQLMLRFLFRGNEIVLVDEQSLLLSEDEDL